MTPSAPQQPRRAPRLAAGVAVAVLAAGVLLSLRGDEGDPAAAPAAPASAAPASAAAPAPAPATTATPTATPPAAVPAVLSGRLTNSEPSLDAGGQQVLLTDLATGRSRTVPVTGFAYRAELPPGFYAVAVARPGAGSSYLASVAPGGGRCDDLIVVEAGERRTADLTYPCLMPGEPTSVAGTPPDPKVAAGLKAPTPQKIERTDEFGEITSLLAQPDTSLRLTVDRVDWLDSPEAAAGSGTGEYPANDHAVRNDNPAKRSYTLSPDAQVWTLPPSGGVELQRSSAQALRRLFAGAAGMPTGPNFWHLQVADGVVVGVEQQYRP